MIQECEDSVIKRVPLATQMEGGTESDILHPFASSFPVLNMLVLHSAAVASRPVKS